MKNRPAPGTLRIIGGRWRSRRLTFPPIAQLRPTADRVRETLFNWLQEKVPGATCVDLYAGSGACGLEALSRGARHVTFVEKSPEAARAIADNLERLDTEAATVCCTTVDAWLTGKDAQYQSRVDIVFIDPPYADNAVSQSCRLLEQSGYLAASARVYVESAQPMSERDFPDGWTILRNKRAGAVHYLLLGCQGHAEEH